MFACITLFVFDLFVCPFLFAAPLIHHVERNDVLEYEAKEKKIMLARQKKCALFLIDHKNA